MDNHLESVYLGQAIRDRDDFIERAKALNIEVNKASSDMVFQYISLMISSAAAMSRIFWPPNRKSLHRGLYLRQSVGLDDDHPLKDRSLRNHFEHIDERLDEWAEKSTHRSIIKRLYGSRKDVGGDAIGDTDIIHNFDPSTNLYFFRGEQFDLQKITNAVIDAGYKIDKRISEINKL